MTVLDDVRKLQARCRELDEQIERTRSAVERHDEQMNGQRGLSAAIDALAEEVKSLRRAMYWVGGIIFTGAIGFAFSVLTVFQNV